MQSQGPCILNYTSSYLRIFPLSRLSISASHHAYVQSRLPFTGPAKLRLIEAYRSAAHESAWFLAPYNPFAKYRPSKKPERVESFRQDPNASQVSDGRPRTSTFEDLVNRMILILSQQ